jgi:putative resolvase
LRRQGRAGQQGVKEIGSGVNESRPQFLNGLADPTLKVVMVEHQERATRFGFRFFETLQEQQGRHIEVVNWAENGGEELWADLLAIVSSCCARLYGQRRAQRTTETQVKALNSQEALAEEGEGATG